jgi:hypothetical protein
MQYEADRRLNIALIALPRSLDEDLKVIESAHDEKLRALESELLAKDQEWKRQCLEEETRLKAELQEWCAKVRAILFGGQWVSC